MARRIYFSFHYERDIERAMVVRNCNKLLKDDSFFSDSSLEEKARTEGESAVRRLINQGIEGTSVTCVLIGAETYARPWVRYEIAKSLEHGNGLFGIYLDSLSDFEGHYDARGFNPFDYIEFIWTNESNAHSLMEWRNSSWQRYEPVPSVGSVGLLADPSGPIAGQISSIASVYEWDTQRGAALLALWSERAAVAAGR
jgi:hypothetical protein